MATIRIPILGFGTVPDDSGDVYFDTFDAFATNDFWKRMVAVFKDTGNKMKLHGGFTVPKDYVGSPKFVVVWSSDINVNDVEWGLEYRCVGGNDTESLDQATAQQTIANVADTGPSADWERLEVELSATAGNFAVDDEVTFNLYRDGSDAGDTLVGNAVLFALLFEYSDA